MPGNNRKAGVSRRVVVARPSIVKTGRILQNGRVFEHLQQKKYGLKAMAEERKAADERYRSLLNSSWDWSFITAMY